jgi:hypothetical protein
VWWFTVLASLSFFLAPSGPWLAPGLLLTGPYCGNNPAVKSYIYLEPTPGTQASLLALGAGLLTPAMGRATDLYGPSGTMAAGSAEPGAGGDNVHLPPSRRLSAASGSLVGTKETS